MSINERTNILLIVTDEQCTTECGAYGPTVCKTPHLDELASQSCLFENAYTTCPLCSPARGSIITGLYPHAHGVTCNTEDTGCCVQELNDSPTLLPHVLKAQGYRCGFTGKWHLGTVNGNMYNSGRKPALPSDFGYEGYDFPGHGGIGNRYPLYRDYLKQHGLEFNVTPQTDMTPLHYGVCNIDEAHSVPAFITDHVIEMIQTFTRDDQPFFIQQNFWGPHQPYFVPQEALDEYADVPIEPWPNYDWDPHTFAGPHVQRILPNQDKKTWDDWAKLLRYKYAAASMIDRQIGRLMTYLQSTGLLENTLVIFTSDHGDHLGRHGGLIDKGFSHFEENVRIPMMIRYPSGQTQNTDMPPHRRHDLVSLADIYSTVIDAAGAEVPASHGYSLLNPDTPQRQYVVTEFHGVNSIACSTRTIRNDRFKYGWNCVGSDELYDLQNDPHENDNLIEAPTHKDILKTLRHQLAEWMVQTKDSVHRQFVRYNA